MTLSTQNANEPRLTTMHQHAYHSRIQSDNVLSDYWPTSKELRARSPGGREAISIGGQWAATGGFLGSTGEGLEGSWEPLLEEGVSKTSFLTILAPFWDPFGTSSDSCGHRFLIFF